MSCWYISERPTRPRVMPQDLKVSMSTLKPSEL